MELPIVESPQVDSLDGAAIEVTAGEGGDVIIAEEDRFTSHPGQITLKAKRSQPTSTTALSQLSETKSVLLRNFQGICKSPKYYGADLII
jgi:hypothetical protein